MIVDDEPIILDKLQSIIDWEKHNCRIVAMAENSDAAMKLAIDTKPRIIFSDICMPLMNGIELAEALRKELPQSLVILISGYDDFIYAQQAIEAGVFRYLLKPINTDKFVNTLLEAQQYLISLEQELKEKECLKARIKESLPRLKEKFFTDLISGDLRYTTIEQQLRFLGLNPSSNLYGVLNVHPDDYGSLTNSLPEAELQLYQAHLLNLLENALMKQTSFWYGFQNKPGETLVVFGVESNQIIEGFIQGIQSVQARMEEIYNITFSAGLGRLYADFESIDISYRETLLALDFKLWAGKKVIIPYQDIENTQAGHLVYQPDYDGFISALREGNQDKAFGFVDQIFSSFKSQEYTSKSFLHLTMLGMVNQVIRSLLEFNIAIEEVLGPAFDPLQEINALETLLDLEDWFKKILIKAMNEISRHKQDVSKNFVAKAKSYMDLNYADPNLNLAKVAENVFVSSCYLSHLFKEITGNTVIEHLTKTRIRAAKKLLKETRAKVYEIAEQVGFSDYHYFGIVFKKSTGLAPLEYRDKVQFDNFI
jgi:two-component system response regulator YesN